MAIPSIWAEAGFATGAGGSGAFAVVGCGDSGFLFPHIVYLCLPRLETPAKQLAQNRGAKQFSALIENGTSVLRA
jgi:hypothetical protein